jgi:hypothetical protein
MKTALILLTLSLALVASSRVLAYGGCHSGSFHASDGHWSSSGSSSWTTRSGQTYNTSHSASGQYGDGWHTGSGSYHGSAGGSANWNRSAATGYGWHASTGEVSGGAYGGAVRVGYRRAW